jgi:hypothetical protein
MINLSWSGDQELKKALEYVSTRIDKKISWEMNGLAYKAQQEVKQQLPNWLDLKKGANFVKQSVVYDRSTPSDLTVTVGFLDRMYLAPLLEMGGQRHPLSTAIGIPVGEKPIVKNIKTAYAKGAFSATIGGVEGLWLRKKTKKSSSLQLLYNWKPQTNYKPNQMNFYDVVYKVFDVDGAVMVQKAVDELVSRYNSK